jgi:hypothetical protein
VAKLAIIDQIDSRVLLTTNNVGHRVLELLVEGGLVEFFA